MKSIEFYYDFGSPTAYLAWTQILKADEKKFRIEYRPVLLGGESAKIHVLNETRGARLPFARGFSARLRIR